KPKNEREAESVKAVTLQVTPEQVEKLALAATEGKLRLVMRNATDQGDEQTTGVNKQTLLSGEHAMPAPEPGAMKSEQPKVAPAAAPRSYAKPRMEMPRQEQKASVPVPATTPQAPRNTVEMIESSKRRIVEFP
ncbi:MAG TPA: RcpC/CpaB family pilus assembly protein, partial [Pyrinomonadaceae bacterium]|nr:RcpC/CpaB family pilus assembly protein [Pyrinomonadaceae bacterium]